MFDDGLRDAVKIVRDGDQIDRLLIVQKLRDSLADEVVILAEDDSEGFDLGSSSLSGRCAQSGSSITIVVPFASADRISTLPPRASARSAMFVSPDPVGIRAGSNP